MALIFAAAASAALGPCGAEEEVEEVEDFISSGVIPHLERLFFLTGGSLKDVHFIIKTIFFFTVSHNTSYSWGITFENYQCE